MVKALQNEKLPVRFRLLLMVVLFWLVLSGVSFGQDKGFYFVQITDTHLGIPGNRARTQQVVAAVNRLPMEILCLVHTGDIIDRSKRLDEQVISDAVSVFKGLKPAVHFLPGNNDINLEEATQTSRVDYERYFGSLISRAEYHGVVFLFAYTDPLRKSVAMEGYDPLGAINAQLEAAVDGRLHRPQRHQRAALRPAAQEGRLIRDAEERLVERLGAADHDPVVAEEQPAHRADQADRPEEPHVKLGRCIGV